MFAPDSDPSDLRQMGWGLVTPPDLDPAIRSALDPLIRMRQEQATDWFKAIEYRRGESASSFRSRHGLGAGMTDPSRLPYYLLIAASPEQIPFVFQQHLDFGLAVGRVHFDHVAQYARYAESVVAAESSATAQARQLVLFAPRHDEDPHSAALAQLVEQLSAETLRESDWRTLTLVGRDARKSTLMDVLSTSPGSAMLLAAAHTVRVASEGSDRRIVDGALICQEWPGLHTPPGPSEVFAGPDVPDSGAVHGLISILWGSNTAGNDASSGIPIVSALGQRLLSAGSGNALAVIGFAGRMLGMSLGVGDPSPRQALSLAIRAMTQGQRVGHALQALSETVGALASELSEALEEARVGRELDATHLVHLWSTVMDLRRVVVLGDPAVRLPAAVAGRPA